MPRGRGSPVGWRWIVVVAGVAVLCSLPFLASAFPASVPRVTARQLESRILGSQRITFSGYAESDANFGLPALPAFASVAQCLGFEHTAFRLETHERYVDDEEDEPIRRFLAGEPPDDAWFMDWYDAVVQLAAAGKRMQRVRVVSEPHSDYTRFGIDLARRLNVPAGEDIRYLPRQQAENLGLPHEDFWLLDSSRVLALHFDGDVLLGAELVTDPAAVAQRAYWRDAAWRSGVPVDEYAGT